MRTLKRKLLEQGNLVKRLEKLERRKKEREWKSQGLEKQAVFAQEVIDYNEELASRLEMEYGAITNPDLKEFISKGEKAVTNRLHLLKVADRFGWSGAIDFEKEELGRNAKEEKLLRQIRKDHESKNEKKSQVKQRYPNYGAGGRGDSKDRKKGVQETVKNSGKECYKCGKYGHLQRDCRQKSKDRGRDGDRGRGR